MSDTLDFPGRDRLVAAVDAAIVPGDAAATTAALRGALCALIRDPDVRLPGCIHQPIAKHYARRVLHNSAQHGYSVVAMTWGPDQGTPLHDHDGQWCVEGVWTGELEITQYELLEQRDTRFRFRAAGGVQAGPGTAGSLIPPHEYHTIRNASPREIAVSVHVYRAELQQCATFVPEAGDWYRRVDRMLEVD